MSYIRSAFTIASSIAIATAVADNAAHAQAARAQLPATDQADQSEGIGEIIVTAQRREEDLQKVPVTVSALNSGSLASANIQSSTELGKLVPALTIQPNSQSVLLFLRGIGSNVSAVGSENSVAFYVDGVYYSRLFPGLVRLNSIERVEVLKGPQGTLYGRNATGGLVNIITKTPEPGDSPKADIAVGYGNYRTVDASAYASMSLSDKVAFDISGVIHHQDQGFGHNIHTGEDVVKDDTKGVRAKLLFDPTAGTRLIVTGEYIEEHGDFAQSSHFRDHRQGIIGSSASMPVVLPQLSFFDTNIDFNNIGKNREAGVSVKLEQDIGIANLANTFAYHDIKQRNTFDADLSPMNIQHTDLFSFGHEVLNDLQVTSKTGSAIDWNLGFFFTDQKQGYNPAYIGFGPGVNLLIFSQSRVQSIAAYGQARFPIVANLKGTVGLRWTRDSINGNGHADFSVAGVGTTPNFIPHSSDARTFKKATYKFVLDYQFTDDIFGYVSFSRGFKGATYNVIPFSPVPTKPETLDAWEGGLKTNLFNNHVNLNLAGFHYELKDPQVIVIPNSGAITTENAGAARINGAEFEIQAVPVRGLNLRASGTWLDAKYTDYGNAALYSPRLVPPFGNLPPISGSANGNVLPYAPKFSFNIGGDYTVQLGNPGEVTLGANLSYASKTYFHPDNVLFEDNKALLDAYLEYKIAQSGASLKFWGQNLTNRKYYTAAVEFGNEAGDLGFPAAPRTYGVTLRFQY